MIRLLSLVTTLTVFANFAGCAFGTPLPQGADDALNKASTFELLSLDPDPRAEKTGGDFHRFNILGSTKIDDKDTRKKLIERFKAGVAENDGTVAACFNPRHGIRITADGVTHEFVICFECYSLQWYIDGKRQPGILITDSPQPAFNKVLKDAGVPLPESTND